MVIHHFRLCCWPPVLAAGLVCSLLCTTSCNKGADESEESAPASSTADELGCDDLTITVDGEPLEIDLPHAVAYQESVTQGTLVELFNHPITCDEAMRSPRPVPEGERVIRVWTDGRNATVGVGASASFADSVRVGELAPPAVGDPVRVCVPEPVELVGTGELRGKTLRVHGLFEGSYCGRQPE